MDDDVEVEGQTPRPNSHRFGLLGPSEDLQHTDDGQQGGRSSETPELLTPRQFSLPVDTALGVFLDQGHTFFGGKYQY